MCANTEGRSLEGMEKAEYEVVLAKVTSRLKECYYAEAERRVGRRAPGRGSRFDDTPIWRTAAEGCLRHEADPFSYVQAAFRASKEKQYVPSVVTLSYNSMKGPWKHYMRGDVCDGDEINELVLSGAERLDQRLSSARKFLIGRNGHIEPVEETYYVLRRNMFNIDVLARIYYGSMDSEVMDIYAEEARNLLRERPDLYSAAKSFPGFPFEKLMAWKSQF